VRVCVCGNEGHKERVCVYALKRECIHVRERESENESVEEREGKGRVCN